MFGLFRKPSAEARLKAETIKAVARAVLALGDDAAISVSEIECGDAACPGTETIVLVMAPGRKTQAFKVSGPLLTVALVDVETALRTAPAAARP